MRGSLMACYSVGNILCVQTAHDEANNSLHNKADDLINDLA
jgi:hypothetical protein